MLVAQTIVAILVAYGVYGNVVREDSKTELRQKREPGKEHAAEVCGLKPSEKLQLEKDAKEHKFDVHPKEQAKGLFQGDIELTTEQQKAIDKIGKTRHQIADKREVIDHVDIKLWPTGNTAIPIEIDPAFEEDHKAKIKEAIDHIREYTNCVTFKKKTSKDTSYIRFELNTMKTCSSQLGRRENHATIISLDKGCFGDDMLIVHEILHAFGFLHEQSRMDRDEYVEIVWNNILPINKNNFKKGTQLFGSTYVGKVFGETYDFGSIMHYGLDDFAIHTGYDTITPKPAYKNDARKVTGQRKGLSDKDVRKIDKLFDCPRKPKVDSCYQFKTMKEKIKFWEEWQTNER